MDATDISTKIIQNSTDFLIKALKDNAIENEIQFFKDIEPENLTELMELEKKVFWLNVYNGFVQLELAGMNSPKIDKRIFSNKKIVIANEVLSLDDIEHGILRGNFWKYGLGFIPGAYLSKRTKNWKSKRLEPRIHFQLNCGAASCPIVRVLTLDNIETELEIGESEYILNESKLDHEKCKIELSGLFLFYLNDFGGMAGIRRLLKKYFSNDDYKIKFSSFDWTKSAKKVHY